MRSSTDKEIITLFRDENSKNEAFTALVECYKQRLYWHIRRIVISHDDADDVLQNTFIKVWSGLHSFKEESQLYTWLYRIATNESLNFLKQKKEPCAV